jgi:predicted homoserine dehydrogenase-like protein
LRVGGLPLGLAHEVKLVRRVGAGQPVCWSDVAVDESLTAVKLRRELERTIAPARDAVTAR